MLKRLLNDPAEGVLVEFVVPQNAALATSNHATRLIKDKSDFLIVKDRVVRTFLMSDMVALKDYDALPMKFMKVLSRRALVQLLNNKDVKAIYANEAHQLLTSSSLPYIKQPEAAAQGYLGAGTAVVILDSGVDYTRPAFGSCTSPGVPAGCKVKISIDIAESDNVLDSSNTGFHGTNVAGIVAAVAPSTSIISLDVVNAQGTILPADVVSAINWSINHKSENNIVAMNLSFGSPSSASTGECPLDYTAEPFSRVRAAGIIPVVATGNNGMTNAISRPACAPGAVRVGAVYDSNIGSSGLYPLASCIDATTGPSKVACFSNSSSIVTLLAPGVRVSAAGIEMTGTSQAAPHVSGAIAVLRSAGAAPNDSIDQVVSRLVSTGTGTTDSRNGIVKPVLNLFAAVKSTKPSAPNFSVQPGYCVGQNYVNVSSSGYVTSYEVYWSAASNFSNPGLVYSGNEGSTMINVESGYVRARVCSGSVCSPYSQIEPVTYYDVCQ